MSLRLSLLTALLSAGACFGATENWPQFRGPAGDGHAEASGLPLTFSETEHVKWKTPLKGKAYSSPVIWGKQLWLTNANPEGTDLSILCLNKETGAIERDQLLFHIPNPIDIQRYNSYASPTPVLQEGRLYVTFGSAGTACVDTKNGKVLWQRTDLQCNHFRGAGSSPIVWGNLMIMNFDGSDFEYVIALDKETGKTVWKTDRSVDYKDTEPGGHRRADGDFRKAFNTPDVVTVQGQPMLISSGANAHYAYDPRTGKEIWRLEFPGSHSAADRPVFGFGNAYVTNGFGKNLTVAIKLQPPGKTPPVLTEENLAWTARKAPTKPSLLLIGDALYMVDDSGIASCLDAKTGAEVWRQRLPGTYSASPVFADGRIYFSSENGNFTAVAAEREFKILGESKVEDGFMASPAVSGNALYLRMKAAIYRVEK